MSINERWQQVDRVFQAAVELEPEKRSAFLNEACHGDEQLRQKIEAMLACDDRGWQMIEKSAVEVAAPLLSDEQPQLSSGQSFGHYEIEKMIGEGGMGEVYLAADKLLNRKIALKLLPADYTRDKERLRRFQQEANAASSLNHPNILTIYELRETDGRQYIATEFVDGETLRQRLKRAPLPLAETLDISIQLASALAAAHQAGIVHRDIKPENIMLRPDGYVKVLDFGLAKLTEQVESAPAMRRVENTNLSSGLVLGTVKYMSPEQASGLSVDSRSDIFSFGAVLYEMINGRAPFTGDTPKDLIAAIMKEKPALPPNTPAELQSTIQKTLNKDKEGRYQTVEALLIDLKALKETLDVKNKFQRPSRGLSQAALAPDSTQSTAATPSTQAISTATSIEYLFGEIKHHKSVAGLATAMLIISTLGIGYFVYRSNRRHSGSPEKITRLTLGGGGIVGKGAISPDGQYLAYVSGVGGMQSVWLRQLATNTNTPLIPPSKVEYQSLTFSPDGYSLFYFGSPEGEEPGLFQVPLLGGVPRKVSNGISGTFTFAPDNAHIAFIRGYPSGETALFEANVDGTNERKLAARQPPSSFAGAAWSPDGQRIVCTQSLKENNILHWSLVTIATADGAESQIKTKEFRYIGQIAWLSDGNGFLTIAAEEDGGGQIWEIDYPNGNARRISNDVGSYSGFGLTADSKSLVATRNEVVANIWNQPATEVNQSRQITSGTATRDGWAGIAWTPDGRIVYSSHASGRPDIWIMNADGSNPQQLTTDMGSVFNGLAVSPDGRYIVFVSRRAGSSNLWRIDIDGQNPKQLTNGPGEFNPIFSADGRWVRYMAGSGPMKMPVDGGEAIPSGDTFLFVLGESPDGKLKAYDVPDNSQDDTTKRIAVAPYSGGDPIAVLELPPNAQLSNGMRWTPDGRAITYIANRGDDVTNIWNQPVDGGPAKQLTDFKADRIMRFAWSVDGKQLAFVRTTSRADLVLMQNFR
jgi:serine/threonine protein kinase